MVDGANDRHMDRLTEPDFPSNDRFLQHVSYVWCRRASPGRAPCQGKATCLPKFQCVAVILDSAGTPKIPSHRPEDTRKWNDNVSALDYEGDAIEQRERVDGRRHVVVKLASFQDVSDHRRKGGGAWRRRERRGGSVRRNQKYFHASHGIHPDDVHITFIIILNWR